MIKSDKWKSDGKWISKLDGHWFRIVIYFPDSDTDTCAQVYVMQDWDQSSDGHQYRVCQPGGQIVPLFKEEGPQP